MKVLIGAAVAAMVLASPAVAQTGQAPAAQAQTPAAPALPISPNCAGFDAAPELPDGATANANAMNAANLAYTTWGQARLAKLQACRADVDAVRAQLDQMVQSHNNANHELEQVTQRLEAEVAEYNARGNRNGTTRARSGN